MPKDQIAEKCQAVRKFYAHLRRVLPTPRPTRLRFVERIEGKLYGEASIHFKVFVLKIDLHHPVNEMMTSFFDEYAHALAWTPREFHSNAWGIAYARITRAWEKWHDGK